LAQQALVRKRFIILILFKLHDFFLFHYENLGKTSFALSLPGVPNHVCGRFSAEDWRDDADYIILDNIDWPNWKNEGFPNPRELLTGQSHNTVCTYVFS
jgi:hypothetical protein